LVVSLYVMVFMITKFSLSFPMSSLAYFGPVHLFAERSMMCDTHSSHIFQCAMLVSTNPVGGNLSVTVHSFSKESLDGVYFVYGQVCENEVEGIVDDDDEVVHVPLCVDAMDADSCFMLSVVEVCVFILLFILLFVICFFLCVASTVYVAS
jgi:hypothetical protein